MTRDHAAAQLFVITDRPDETAEWLTPLRGSLDVVVSASPTGTWQFLQGETVCAVVVHLRQPADRAPRAVSALLGRPELRDVPVFVLMPMQQVTHSTLSGVVNVHLVDEARAGLDLPVLLLRSARRLTQRRGQPGLRRALPQGPVGALQKASSNGQRNGATVSADSDLEPTTRLATSSGERS